MRTTNALLDQAARAFPVGAALPSETTLARRFKVSRTAIRASLERLAELGLAGRDGAAFVIRRGPCAADYYATGAVESRAHLVERRFMEMALSGELQPGARFTEAELARRVGVSTVSVREFLIGFARHGVLVKGSGGWRLGAFDRSFAEELASVRRLFELDAIRRFAEFSADDPVWTQVSAFQRRHTAVREAHTREPRLFAELDQEFHRFLLGRLHNRFADGLYDIVALVFHYHYQWDKRDEGERNARALDEHEAVLHALAARDIPTAAQRLDTHLATALRSLLASATIL